MKKYKLIIYFLILVIHSVLYAQMGNIDLDNMTLEEVTQKIKIETNKENLAGWYSLRAMMYYAKTNDIDKAMKDIDKALELYPLAVFYTVKGEFYYNLEDYKHCIEYIDKALESNLSLSFKPASAYYMKGLALYKLLEYEKAIENFTKAITLGDNYAHVYGRRGDAYLATNRKDYLEAAYNDFVSAFNLSSQTDYLDAYMAGYVAIHLKKYKEAFYYLDISLKENPRKYAIAYYFKTCINLQLGNLDDTERSASDYLKYSTSDDYNMANVYQVYLIRAIVYIKKNKFKLAETSIQSALSLDDEIYIPYMLRAILYFKIAENSLTDHDKIKYRHLSKQDLNMCRRLNKNILIEELTYETIDVNLKTLSQTLAEFSSHIKNMEKK